MNIQEVREEVSRAIDACLWKDESRHYRIPQEWQHPVPLMSTSGIGKTAIMRQLAKEEGLALVSYTISHHTRQSAIDLPIVTEQLLDGRPQRTTDYAMSKVTASVYEMMERSGKREGILFLDGINTVSETLAPTTLQFPQYETPGIHRVPGGWVTMTADSPPKYNRAVWDSDMVTKDRVRELHMTADSVVRKRCALERGTHGVVLALLGLEPEAFLFVRVGETGKHFVAARGQEGLSDSLKTCEAPRLNVSGALTTSFLQDAGVVDKFYRYYLPYQKYTALYGTAGILDDREKADITWLRKTGFDEKLSFIALFSAVIGEYVWK